MNCICNNTPQDCELSDWHCPINCNGNNKICTRHVLTQSKYGGKACGNLTKPNPNCEITPSVTGDQVDDWCGCPTYGSQTIGFNGRCNPAHKRSDYYSGPNNFWINIGEDVCKCAQDPDPNSSSCKAVQGNGPPLPTTITRTSPTDSASLFDVARGWLRANGNNINSCKYAMAIAVGEGCICTGPSSAGVVHSEWGSTYGAFGSCDSNATHKFPCSGVYRSTEKQGFPKGNNGGPWQLTSVPTTCNSEKDWIKCYAKETMDYLNSTLHYPGFIGCKNVMGNATKQGNICVAKYGNRPITWVFPNHVNNCGDSGGGDSGGGSVSSTAKWEPCNFTTIGTDGWPTITDGSDASCDGQTLQDIKSNCTTEQWHKPYKPIVPGNCNGANIAAFPCGKNMCILHGTWGDIMNQTTTGGYNCTLSQKNRTPDFEKTSKIWFDTFTKNGGTNTNNVFLCLNDPQTGTPIQAAMSIGHGVLNGICGDLALIKYGDRYLINYQVGPRAWSLEISRPGIDYLNQTNAAGGKCNVPDVMGIKFNWDNILSDGTLPVCPNTVSGSVSNGSGITVCGSNGSNVSGSNVSGSNVSGSNVSGSGTSTPTGEGGGCPLYSFSQDSCNSNQPQVKPGCCCNWGKKAIDGQCM